MEVELGFGEPAQPGFGVGLIGFGDLSGACHWISLHALRREVAAGADGDGRTFGQQDVVGCASVSEAKAGP